MCRRFFITFRTKKFSEKFLKKVSKKLFSKSFFLFQGILFVGLITLFAEVYPSLEQDVNGCVIAVNGFTGAKLLVIDDEGYCNQKFPPGSAIKPFALISAVKSGFAPSLVVRCFASSPETPVRNSCWYRPGHGLVDLEKAIAFSCDRYFTELAKLTKWRIFLNVLVEFSIITDREAFELGTMDRQTQIETMVGLTPTIKVLPFDLLLAYTALFNGGYLFESGEGDKLKLKRKVAVNRKAEEILIRGMRGASEYGTAIEVGKAYPFLRILSKTGTGVFNYQNIVDHNRTHGWYVGLINMDTKSAGHSPITLVAFSFNGTGAHDAVPLALKFFPRVIGTPPR